MTKLCVGNNLTLIEMLSPYLWIYSMKILQSAGMYGFYYGHIQTDGTEVSVLTS